MSAGSQSLSWFGRRPANWWPLFRSVISCATAIRLTRCSLTQVRVSTSIMWSVRQSPVEKSSDQSRIIKRPPTWHQERLARRFAGNILCPLKMARVESDSFLNMHLGWLCSQRGLSKRLYSRATLDFGEGLIRSRFAFLSCAQWEHNAKSKQSLQIHSFCCCCNGKKRIQKVLCDK